MDEEFVRNLDDELVNRDIPLHARPFHVMLAWMRHTNTRGDILNNDAWAPLMEIYRKLYPDGNFNMPALLEAGVAIRDRMYPVWIGVGHGTFAINPIECIRISKEELNYIFRHYQEQGWRAFYGVCDLLDFAYATDDLVKTGSPAKDLLINAQSAIAANARTLLGALDIDSSVQSACLAAELSLKAVLAHLGWTESRLKDLSHNLRKIAEEVSGQVPSPTDTKLHDACAKFPNYTHTRYHSHGLTRVELMKLAMRSQFVAANAVRRISERNMLGQVEAQGDIRARPDD